jgi:hypothetical protein
MAPPPMAIEWSIIHPICAANALNEVLHAIDRWEIISAASWSAALSCSATHYTLHPEFAAVASIDREFR